MYLKEGNFDGKKLKIAIICSRFNEAIVSKLLEGALDCLKRHNVQENNIDIIYTPGAFEIPLITKKLAVSKKYNSIVSLGAIIRGETPHFEYVCSEVSKGIASVGLEFNTPIIFGILTTNTTEEALARAGGKNGNKGFESALSAIEMANLIKNIEQ